MCSHTILRKRLLGSKNRRTFALSKDIKENKIKFKVGAQDNKKKPRVKKERVK